jgi:hypothetical protein
MNQNYNKDITKKLDNKETYKKKKTSKDKGVNNKENKITRTQQRQKPN